MNTLQQTTEIISELMNTDAGSVTQESYLVRDLGMESIDFLELCVMINSRFGISVDDQTFLLRDVRLRHGDAVKSGTDPVEALTAIYPHLSESRLAEIIGDLSGGPAIKVKDIVSYVESRR